MAGTGNWRERLERDGFLVIEGFARAGIAKGCREG